MQDLRRTALIVLGWALLVPGLILVVLPPPFAFGIFLVLPGVALLVANSKFMRRVVQRVRARHGRIDRAMVAVETRLPDWFHRHLKRTRPGAIARAARRKRSGHPGQEA